MVMGDRARRPAPDTIENRLPFRFCLSITSRTEAHPGARILPAAPSAAGNVSGTGAPASHHRNKLRPSKTQASRSSPGPCGASWERMNSRPQPNAPFSGTPQVRRVEPEGAPATACPSLAT